MAEKIEVAKLDVDVSGLTQATGEVLGEITKLKEAQKELRSITGNLTNATEEQRNEYVKQDAELKKLNAQYNQNKAVLAETTTGINNLSNALQKENKSITEAQKNNRQLTKLRGDLNLKTKEGQAALTQINAKIDQNNAFIRTNVSQLEKQRLNIGNYASALDKVVPGLGSFITNLQGSTESVKAATAGINTFKVALLSTGIGAIVIALGTLIAAFASTQEGMDKINAVLRPLKVLFEEVKGVIQELSLDAFDSLKKAIDNPKQAIIDLGNAILENVINRFKAFGVLAEAVALIFEGEFKQAAKTATDAFIQFNTGITDATDKIVDSSKAVSDFVSSAIKDGQELDMLIKQIEQREIALAVPLSKARNELRKYKQEAEDTSRTEAERLESLQKAVDAQNLITKNEQELQDLLIRKKELENSFNDTSREDELAYQELIAQRYELETAGIENLTTLQNLRNTIINQQAAKQKKQADDFDKDVESFILGQEEEKDVIEEKNKAIEESIKVADDWKKAMVKASEVIAEAISGAFEVATIAVNQFFTNQSIKRDNRLAQIEEDKQAEIERYEEETQAQIERIEAERERRLSNDQLTNDQREAIKKNYDARIQKIEQENNSKIGKIEDDLEEKRRKNQIRQAKSDKKQAIFNAIIQTARWVVQYGLITPQAIAAAILGGVQVAAIKSQPIPKFATGTERVLGAGTETSDSIPALLSKNERVVKASDNRKIGFDLPNSELVMAAQMYRQFKGGVSMSDKGIISAVNENTKVLKNKPTVIPNITEKGIYTIVNKRNAKITLKDGYYND